MRCEEEMEVQLGRFDSIRELAKQVVVGGHAHRPNLADTDRLWTTGVAADYNASRSKALNTRTWVNNSRLSARA